MSKGSKIKAGVKRVKKACGLCGKTGNLIKTECCRNWICDDEEEYDMSTSPFRSSCSRNHRRYSLCAFHYGEDHKGKWQECQKCKDSFPEDSKFFSVEENFEILEDASEITCIASKIACIGCGFESQSKENFAFQVSGKYYCSKDECQKMGKPALSKSTKKKTNVKKVCEAVIKKKVKKACGLCGKTKNLTKTDCCHNWICDDEEEYYMSPNVMNSCYRSHKRYSLCASHYGDSHEGKWQECQKCKESFSEEDFQFFTSEQYNFEILDETSKITCSGCGFESESKESFTVQVSGKYYCIKDECQKMCKPAPSKSTKRKADAKKVSKAEVKRVKKACGLCGSNVNLIKTECCHNWICDDEEEYDMSTSPFRKSCSRNHRRYSLCAFHYGEDHKESKWQECQKCRESFSKDRYKLFSSEQYNFRKLEDVPNITCIGCGFKSESTKGFAFSVCGKYYCSKDECKAMVKPSPCRNTKRKADVKQVSQGFIQTKIGAFFRPFQKIQTN